MLTSQLTHNAVDKRFSVEISDLPDHTITHSITVTSDRTQESVVFDFDRAEYDDEGELQVWVFKIQHSYVLKRPELGGYTLHVFND